MRRLTHQLPRVLLRPLGSVIGMLEEAMARLKLSSVEQLVLTDEITFRAVGRLPSPLLGLTLNVVYVRANCRRAAALHADHKIRAAALASNFGLPTIRIVVHDGGPRINAACAEPGLHHGITPAGMGGVSGGVSSCKAIVPVVLGDCNHQQPQEDRRHGRGATFRETQSCHNKTASRKSDAG